MVMNHMGRFQDDHLAFAIAADLDSGDVFFNETLVDLM